MLNYNSISKRTVHAGPAHTTMYSRVSDSPLVTPHNLRLPVWRVFYSSCWQQMHLTCCLCMGNSSCTSAHSAVRRREPWQQ